jgi:hypothetical protein
MIYIFDTNSISNVLNHYYPTRFPSFWEKFVDEIRNKNIISVREVRHELEERFDKNKLILLTQYNSDFFQQPSLSELSFIGEIYKILHFRQNLNQKKLLKGGPFADPFIIAKGKIITDGIVVTEEESKPNAAKIPNICKHFDVDCINLEGFLTRKNWIF